MSLEELIPAEKSRMYSFFIRTGLVFSTLVIGLCIPFFGKSPLNILHRFSCSISTRLLHLQLFQRVAGLLLSLIGSLFTMLVVS